MESKSTQKKLTARRLRIAVSASVLAHWARSIETRRRRLERETRERERYLGSD